MNNRPEFRPYEQLKPEQQRILSFFSKDSETKATYHYVATSLNSLRVGGKSILPTSMCGKMNRLVELGWLIKGDGLKLNQHADTEGRPIHLYELSNQAKTYFFSETRDPGIKMPENAQDITPEALFQNALRAYARLDDDERTYLHILHKKNPISAEKIQNLEKTELKRHLNRDLYDMRTILGQLAEHGWLIKQGSRHVLYQLSPMARELVGAIVERHKSNNTTTTANINQVLAPTPPDQTNPDATPSNQTISTEPPVQEVSTSVSELISSIVTTQQEKKTFDENIKFFKTQVREYMDTLKIPTGYQSVAILNNLDDDIKNISKTFSEEPPAKKRRYNLDFLTTWNTNPKTPEETKEDKETRKKKTVQQYVDTIVRSFKF